MSREPVTTLEKGNLFFVYQPRVQRDQVESMEDLQRLYMIFSPHGQKLYRLTTVGAKSLPQPGGAGAGPNWCFVNTVGSDPKAIENELQQDHYQTKTRGEREIPAGRPAGEGVYRILRHGDHTHLVYALELPRDRGRVQQALNIEPEGSYLIQIKNPERGGPATPGLNESRQADYPEKLRNYFEGRKFHHADPPDFLDYAGAEFLLIGTDEDVPEDVGIDLDPKKETAATAEIFNDLRMEKSQHPVEPLFKGQWE